MLWVCLWLCVCLGPFSLSLQMSPTMPHIHLTLPIQLLLTVTGRAPHGQPSVSWSWSFMLSRLLSTNEIYLHDPMFLLPSLGWHLQPNQCVLLQDRCVNPRTIQELRIDEAGYLKQLMALAQNHCCKLLLLNSVGLKEWVDSVWKVKLCLEGNQ